MLGIELDSLDKFWLFIAIMGLLRFLFELARVYKSYQENKYFNLEKVKEAFETDKIDNNLRKHLIQTYEKEIFYKVYSLNVSKEARNKIIDISKRNNKIECSTFRKAKNYIDYDGSNITLKYGEIYPIMKSLNKYSSYVSYISFVFLIAGFLFFLFDYKFLLVIYSQIGSPYLLLILGIYAFFASLLCIKKEVSLEAVIQLKNYALSHPNDIKIIYRNSWREN